MKIKFFSVVLFLLIFSIATAQETNYWFNNFGATSTLKGGVEVGGIRSVAAIYYNPGALAFIEGEYLEGQADLLSVEVYSIKNATGNDLDIDVAQTNVIPSIFAYYKRIKKKPKLSYALGVLSRYNSNLSFISEYETEGEFLLPQNELDIFQGQYIYDNRAIENWLNGTIAYRVNDKIGVGLGVNFVIRTQDYVKGYTARAFAKNELGSSAQQFSKLATTNDEQRLKYRALGFNFKPGINIDLDPLKLGLTVTTPLVNVALLNNQATKSQLSVLPDEVVQFYSESNSHNYYKAVYKTPLSINFGAEYEFKKISIGFSGEWFSKVKPYEMIKKDGDSEDQKFPTASNSKFAIPVMANKSIVNAGVSVTYTIKEALKYIGSFRTDFNSFDDSILNRNTDFVPNIAFWDIYHVTSGVVLTGPRANLSLGVDYGFGSSSNNAQFVNMTNANQSNFLRGNSNNSVSANYNNISVTLGFNFNIDKSKGLKSNKI